VPAPAYLANADGLLARVRSFNDAQKLLGNLIYWDFSYIPMEKKLWV
jgi:hypothetical protein